jgi:hypothetical protein
VLELIANILIEGVLTLFSELFNLQLRKWFGARPGDEPLGDAIVGIGLGFVLGIASVYFFPLLALRLPFWQWLNALLSPLMAGLLILLGRKVLGSSKPGVAVLPGRTIVFQAFMVGLAFNLSRMLFGH